MKKYYTVGLMVAVLFFGTQVFAQDFQVCGEPIKTTAEWVAGSDLVAVGEFVTAVAGTENGNAFTLATFQVSMFAKGDPGRIITIETFGDATCPPTFGTNVARNGQSYLIFAHTSADGRKRYSVGNGELKNTAFVGDMVASISGWKSVTGKK